MGGKQKKIQLKMKKHGNAVQIKNNSDDDFMESAPVPRASFTVEVKDSLSADKMAQYTSRTVRINQQPGQSGRGGGGRSNRFNLEFSKEKLDAEFERGKKEMHERVLLATPGELEYFSDSFFPDGLNYPRRPQRFDSMSKEELDMNENKNVRLFEEDVKFKFGSHDLNLFEQNIETWRQLWRVCERSHVLLFIADIRFAVCQFPPYVYEHLKAQGKGIILVLNKIDLVPASLVLAWKEYFIKRFPGIKVVPFCSHESKTDKHRRARLAFNSSKLLIDAVGEVADKSVDLSSWRAYLEKAALELSLPSTSEVIDVKPKKSRRANKNKSDYYDKQQESHQNYDESDEDCSDTEVEVESNAADISALHNPAVFTIGTIGYPNVGKSSLINAIMGKNMVGVSPTPGHTKHFQTHYLTPSKELLLCDCPGLVFPAICPYKLQVLSGTFPISQVRAPMSVIGYLASHVNVQRVLNITLPEEYRDHTLPANQCWTPYSISEAWARKRNYFVKSKGGREDVSRAGNELLRFSLNAKNNLVLALKPVTYHRNLSTYESHDDVGFIQTLQGVHAENTKLTEKLLSYSWGKNRTKNVEDEHQQKDGLGGVKKKRNKKKRKIPVNQFASLELSEEITEPNII